MASKHFAVIGDPVGHSLSPTIHKAAYKQLGLDWDYQALQVPAGTLSTFLQDNPQLGGLSVTMPLKFEAAAYSIPSNYEAKEIAVVNTLVPTDQGFNGYNTDVFGIVKAISQTSSIESERIAVIGSGATARSAVLAAKQLNEDAEITVLARNESHRDYFQHLMERIGSAGSFSELNYDLADFDLVLNTTPVTTGFTYKPGATVLNASYSNDVASSTAVALISGTEMLIWQAIAQIRIFLFGDVERALDDEAELAATMRIAINQRFMGE